MLTKPILLFALIISLLIPECFCEKISKNIDSLKYLIEKTNDPKANIDLTLDLSRSYYSTNIDESIKLSSDAIVRAKKLNYFRGLTRANKILAYCYSKKGNYKKCIELYIENFKYLNKGSIELADTYNNIALVYIKMQLPEKAMKYSDLSYKILEHNYSDELMLSCLINYADSYELLKQYDKQLVCLNKTIVLTKMNHEHLLYSAYYNIGWAYWNLKKFDKAFEYYKLGLDISIANKDSLEIARAYSNLGTTLLSQGDMANAFEYFQKSIAMDQIEMLGHTYLELVDYFILLNNKSEAIRYFELAQNSRTIDVRKFEKSCQALVIFLKKNTFEEQAKYNDLLLTLKDSIQKISSIQINVARNGETDELEKRLNKAKEYETYVTGFALLSKDFIFISLGFLTMLLLVVYYQWKIRSIKRSMDLLGNPINELKALRKGRR